MADVAVIILRVVAEIRDAAEGINENDRQACRLFKRVSSIEPAVVAVKQGTKLTSSESLRQLLATVEKIRSFLEGYTRTTKFNRALRRKSNAAKFAEFGVILTEGMQALQLNVAVDTWAKEDVLDRQEDLENMVDMMETMERNRTDNHAEVMGILKALRNDERAELAGWVEVDYSTELDFEGSAILGSGAFGEVRTAKWNGADVAVKHLIVHGVHDDTVRALRKEIRVHSSLHFDYVVQLFAASTTPPHLCLVTELASEGSLWEYLHSTTEPLAHALQTAFLYDIARGMSFLHARGILHRDLKSANVLVFSNRRLKLCDFGLSKIKTESSRRSKQGAVGTAQWMSPEEMDGSRANEQTDVYSFGVVCFEVATRTEPFKGLNQIQITRAVADKEKRPRSPEWASLSPDIVPVMEQCWKQNPAQRPEGFRFVVRTLASVVSRVGDPRISRAAAGGAPTSSAKRVDTAPRTIFAGVDASSSRSEPVSEPDETNPAVSPKTSLRMTPAESVSDGDGSVLVGSAMKKMVPGAGKAYAPYADPSIESRARLPTSGASSGALKKLTNIFGRKLQTKEPRVPPAAAHQQLRVLFPYTAADDTELSLTEGEVVKVVSQDESGWWTGEKGGRVGFFPSNYTNRFPPASPAAPISPASPETGPQQALVLFTYMAADKTELSLTEGEVVKVVSQGTCEWWTVEKGGRLGLFPSNYVRLIPAGHLPSPV